MHYGRQEALLILSYSCPVFQRSLSLYPACEMACSSLYCETYLFIMAGNNSEVGQKQLLHEVVMCDKLNAGF